MPHWTTGGKWVPLLVYTSGQGFILPTPSVFLPARGTCLSPQGSSGAPKHPTASSYTFPILSQEASRSAPRGFSPPPQNTGSPFDGWGATPPFLGCRRGRLANAARATPGGFCMGQPGVCLLVRLSGGGGWFPTVSLPASPQPPTLLRATRARVRAPTHTPHKVQVTC